MLNYAYNYIYIMNKKEIASYIVIDSANFVKKTVTKSTFFTLKFLSIGAVIASTILFGDSVIHKQIYEKHNISSFDLIKNNNVFIIEKPINAVYSFDTDMDNKNTTSLRHSYVPIIAEFSNQNTYNRLTEQEQYSLNNNLIEQYESICESGIISRLVCFKYNKYEEIKKLKI